KYSVEEAKERDVTYNEPLRVKVRLINNKTGEIKEQEVFMGDFPLMTDTGTFIINGAERVIVSQLVRSPSVYYSEKINPNGKKGLTATVIPNRGAWLEMETDARDTVYVRIDRTRKLPITVLLRALGFSTDEDIINLIVENEYLKNTLEKDNMYNVYVIINHTLKLLITILLRVLGFSTDEDIINLIGENEYLKNTLEKDNTETTEKALLEIYERLRPGEPPIVENAKNLL